MAQHMLECGANDIDGTVVWYDITKVSTQKLRTKNVQYGRFTQRAIQDAGFVPVERDTLYRTCELAKARSWSKSKNVR